MNSLLPRRIHLLYILITLLTLSSLCGESGAMLGRKDGTLERLYLQTIQQGKIPPTTVQSISKAEARFYGLLSPEDIDDADDTDDTATWHGSFSVQPFMVGWSGLDPEPWDEGYQRKLADFPLANRLTLNDPLLAAGLSFGSGSFFAEASIDFSTDSLLRSVEEDGILGFWQPGEYFSWWIFPKVAYAAWSGNHVTIAAGRFPTGIGLGKANLFLNGQAFWYDHLQFSWWSEKMRFFSLWGTSSPHLNEQEYEVQTNFDPGNTGENFLGWDINDNHDYSSGISSALKMFTYHRVEFKPFRWLGFALSEMQMVGGKTPDFSNLMPLMIWHNTYSSGTTNVMSMADVWAVPLPGLLVYGEFIMDDSRAPSESKTSKPNCWGWEAGATAVLPIAPKDWTISVNLEYSHVDEWTYARWQPYLTMTQRQILTGGHRGLDIPLGHPEGNDVTQLGLSVTALGRDEHRIEFGYTWITKGPLYLGRIEEVTRDGKTYQVPVYYDFDDWAGAGELNRITGSTKKYSHVFNLRCVWPVWKNTTVDAEIDYLVIQNYAHREGNTRHQTVIKTGIQWKYDRNR